MHQIHQKHQTCLSPAQSTLYARAARVQSLHYNMSNLIVFTKKHQMHQMHQTCLRLDQSTLNARGAREVHEWNLYNKTKIIVFTKNSPNAPNVPDMSDV